MRHVFLMFAAVALMGCATTPKAGIIPNSSEAEAAIETAIRRSLKKPTGDLTKADLEKVKGLYLGGNRISDLSPLAGLTNLTKLDLYWNQVTDLSPLASLTNLVIVYLDDADVCDLSTVETHANLVRIRYNRPYRRSGKMRNAMDFHESLRQRLINTGIKVTFEGDKPLDR